MDNEILQMLVQVKVLLSFVKKDKLVLIVSDDIDQSSDNVSSSSISYTYILYIPLGISYVHPITVLVQTGEHINDMLIPHI